MRKIIRTNTSRVKRIVALLFALALLPLFLTLGVNLYMKHATRAQIQTLDELRDWNADCILVLGAGVWGEDEPSPLLEDRLLSGLEAYAAQVAPKLLMSGDHGQSDYNEVETMKNFALKKGLPPAAVFMDHAGFSTYESLYRAKAIFGVQKLLIVTQRYHLPRALFIADHLGLEARGLAADRRALGGQRKRDLREIAARVKDFGFALLKPQTSYKGPLIDLNGPATQCYDRRSLDALYRAHPTLQANYPERLLLVFSYLPLVEELYPILGPPAEIKSVDQRQYLYWPLPEGYQIIAAAQDAYLCLGVRIIKSGRQAADFDALVVGSSGLDDLLQIDPYANVLDDKDSGERFCEELLPDGRLLQLSFKKENGRWLLLRREAMESVFKLELYGLFP